ncbi:MAG: alpha/beta hydrolase [Ktedonobacteraceae bacterium]|nr:alpha/beta hydrolase [Ktedonobacteraceae bacterium]
MIQLFFPTYIKRQSLFLACLILLSLILGACGEVVSPSTSTPSPSTSTPTASTALPPARYSATIQRNISYGPLAAETLNLCLPKDAAGPRPAVILIHGGACIKGDASMHDTMCQRLAEQGFVAATINYRLAQSSDASTRWPAQLVDTQLAVRWLRSQATRLNLDPQRLCSWGTSAGGHLAVFVGNLKTIHPGDQAHLLADQSPTVSCVVDNFGPVDLVKLAESPQGKSSRGQEVMQTLLGVSYQQNAVIYRDASPIFVVSNQSVPTLIVQGTRDTVVPPDQSAELQQALQQHHVAVQYISYDGGHGFQGLTKQQKDAIFAQEINYLIAQQKP